MVTSFGCIGHWTLWRTCWWCRHHHDPLPRRVAEPEGRRHYVEGKSPKNIQNIMSRSYHISWTYCIWCTVGFCYLWKYFIVVYFPESVWAKGSSQSGGLLYIFTCSPSHPYIFTYSHVLSFTSSQTHTFTSSHLLTFTYSHNHIFTSSHLHIFTSSHLHIFTSSSYLHIFTSSHLLLIFTSSHLLIFTSSHLHIFFLSSHLHIFTSSHLHIFFLSSHLHIFTSSHLLLIFTSSHLHIFTSSSYLHIFTSSNLLIIFTSSHLHTSSHLSLSLSVSVSVSLALCHGLSPSCSFLFQGRRQCRPGATIWPPFRRKWGSSVKNWWFFATLVGPAATVSHEKRSKCQKPKTDVKLRSWSVCV